MKHDIDEALRIVVSRSEVIARKRELRRARVLSSLGILMIAVLTGLTTIFAGPASNDGGQTVYGSFLLSEEAGAYVLIAVVSFICGILITIAVNRKKHR